MNKKLVTLFLLFTFILTSGFGCKQSAQQVQEAMKPLTLNIWGVWDNSEDLTPIIESYKALHPFITINYRKFRYNEYESELLNAFAEDRGPDIFSINNTWVRKYQSKLIPAPAQIPMVYPVIQGSIQKQIVPETRVTTSLTPKNVKDFFVDTVYDDVIIDGKLYGLPMSLDTLVMYYNRDLLNNSGVTDIPAYWNRDFQQTVKRLTKQDLKGNLIQSGVALGGSHNIERYSDILSVLMMQNGAQMTTNGSVSFQSVPVGSKTQDYNPGYSALRFYTDFSNPVKEVYSWNNDLNNSVDSFVSGNLAFMFGYAYHLPTIKTRAPKLNFGIAKLPQIEGAPADTNFANYWLNTVSKKSKYTNEAWDFVQFMAKSEQVKSYLAKVKKPTALRSLIKEQREDPEIGIFADQVLTAKSWYRGYNAIAAEEAMADMIDGSIKDETKIPDAIGLAVSRIQQTLSQ
ncbi:MAG: extracellular solute-binding protein [Candidatus Falkowbacteria bacterium]